MKRGFAVALLLFGCQSATTSPSAQLVGLRDMVKVGGYLFATSTERDELRVLYLDTGESSSPRKFVRAPNPIQALAIPVLRRPTDLATDTFYSGGTETAGPYVYASSPGTSQISIVWAENVDASGAYTEVGRLSTIAPVTSMTALGAAPTIDGRPQPDTLYFSTFDGTTAQLFRFKPNPPQSAADGGTIFGQDLQAAVVPIPTPTNETIVDMVALPGPRLAIATRTLGSATVSGRALVLDGITGNELVQLQFPGPVRSLHTHAEFDLGNGRVVPAGGRVYGVLDEAACGSSACAGLVAVDSDTGLRSLSSAGYLLGTSVPREQAVAPPLTFGNGIIQSVSLVVNGPLPVPGSFDSAGVPALRALPLLGVASMSSGLIGFFNAGDLRQLNESQFPRAQLVTPDGGVFNTTTTVHEDGTTEITALDAGPAEGPFLPKLANGAAQDETILITYRGLVPGLITLTHDAGFVAGAGTARVGDFIEGCGGGSTVTSASATGFSFAPVCADNPISVRAGAPQSDVVEGTASGYMGRWAPGETFIFAGRYANHFPSYRPDQPAYSFVLPTEPLDPGQFYSLEIDDGYLPVVVQLSTTVCAAGFTTLPGTVIADAERTRAFVAYPSANGIVEIDLGKVRRNFAQETGLLCWR